MGFRIFLALLLAVSIVSESSCVKVDYNIGTGALNTCKGAVGECIGEENELMMDSEIHRRMMAAGRERYISTDALRRNNIPCGRHGASYYDCSRRQAVNPYTRSCTMITRCARDTS